MIQVDCSESFALAAQFDLCYRSYLHRFSLEHFSIKETVSYQYYVNSSEEFIDDGHEADWATAAYVVKISYMTIRKNGIEPMLFRRHSSFIHEHHGRYERDMLMSTDENDTTDVKPIKHLRKKSTSVCLPMISTKPEHSDPVHNFVLPRRYTCQVSPRFTVERSSHSNSVQPLQLGSVRFRLHGLSTSEVFHEPPKMYIYEERPKSVHHRKHVKSAPCIGYVRKRRHTFCSWIFGIVVMVLMTVIIVLQSKGDFS
ncbi:hypothetical protein KIN20_034499 [Parelaphostrongylus tenuis]|uniref:Uncharacterized protein n=1 Tax=Parelaphostrongylus tenuis TaxID=148309 RepID=A0AAD5RAB3_PARTN|nr:hypothetical protein KIN20_034499 [Parelaphostrongylus tenuis]